MIVLYFPVCCVLFVFYPQIIIIYSPPPCLSVFLAIFMHFPSIFPGTIIFSRFSYLTEGCDEQSSLIFSAFALNKLYGIPIYCVNYRFIMTKFCSNKLSVLSFSFLQFSRYFCNTTRQLSCLLILLLSKINWEY